MNIRKATITVSVFYNADTYNPDDISNMSLDDLQYALDEGDCIGMYTTTADDAVPADKVSQALIDIGNDGTYFDEA